MRRLMSVATLPQASVIRPTPGATISSYWRLFFQKHLQHLALLRRVVIGTLGRSLAEVCANSKLWLE